MAERREPNEQKLSRGGRKKKVAAAAKMREETESRDSFPNPLRESWRPAKDLREEHIAACRRAAVVCALFNLVVRPVGPADPDAVGCWPYVLSAGVLKHSMEMQLEGAETGLQFIMLVPAAERSPGVDEPLALSADMVRALKLQGWTVREVPYLPEFEAKMHENFGPAHPYYYTTGMKIHAFGLEHRRVLYLDVDSVFAPDRKLGDLGCFAELLRMDMKGSLAAAPFDAQKALLRMGEENLRNRQNRLFDPETKKYVSVAHGCPIPREFTRFDHPDMHGNPDRRHAGYRMMLTGLMVIEPSPQLMGEMREVILAAKTRMYSDGDMLTHGVTMAAAARAAAEAAAEAAAAEAAAAGRRQGWTGVDMLFAAYRGATTNKPYGTQFGGTAPWRSDPSWESGKQWRAALEGMLQEAGPDLARVYEEHKWCNERKCICVQNLTEAEEAGKT